MSISEQCLLNIDINKTAHASFSVRIQTGVKCQDVEIFFNT